MDKTKTLVLLFLMASSLASRGQDTIQPRYQSVFGDSCATWYLFFDDYESIADGEIYGTETRQAIVGDTIIINGTTYTVLRHMPNLSYGILSDLYDDGPVYVRESPDHSKLYFKEQRNDYPDTISHDVLIMDLDLNIGDTLDTHSWSELIYDIQYLPKIYIDTIYHSNGRKILRTNYHSLIFIEGIGPSFGPCFYARFIEIYGELSLTCYYRDNEPLYHGPMYNPNSNTPCIKGGANPLYVTKESKDVIVAAYIYPNPSRSSFNITLASPSTYYITVISATGNVIYGEEFCGDRISINLQDAPRGVYFVTLANDDNARLTKKIIKL